MAPHGNPSVQKLISERQLPSHLHRWTSVRFSSPISFISGNWNVRHTCRPIMTEGTNKQHAVLIVLITYDDLWYSSRPSFFFFLSYMSRATSNSCCRHVRFSIQTQRERGTWTGGVEQDEDWQGICSWSAWVQYGGMTKMKKIQQTDGGGEDEEEDEQDREALRGGGAVKEKNNTVLRESRNMTRQS